MTKERSRLSKVVQLASCRAGILTQVCMRPDSIHSPLPYAAGTMRWNQPLDSSHQPHLPSFCLHGLQVCGSWWWWAGDCGGPYGFSASYTSNTKQPSLCILSIFFMVLSGFDMGTQVGATICHYSWWGRGQFWTPGRGLINDLPKPEFRNTAWGLPNFPDPVS